MKRGTLFSLRTLAAGLIWLPLTASAQIWFNDGDGLWQDAGNWDGGIPDAPGAIARFNHPGGYIDNRIIVGLTSNVTVGQMLFSDSTGNNTDFTLRANVNNSTNTITLDNGLNPPLIAFTNSATIGDDLRLGEATRPLVLAGTNGLDIVSSGRIILEAPNTYTGPTRFTSLHPLDNNAGAYLRLRNNTALGASGPGNGTTVSAVSRNGSQAFDRDPATRIDRSIQLLEDLTFEYRPSNSNNNTRAWPNTIYVESANAASRDVEILGDITLRRIDSDINNVVTGDVSWDIQTGNSSTNQLASSLVLGTIIFDDQSNNTTAGNYKNRVELNASNAGDEIRVTGSVDEGARIGDPIDFALLKNGDGTVRLQGANNMEGDLRAYRGITYLEHTNAVSAINQLRIGETGTTAGGPTPDELRVLVNVGGLTQIRGGSANINLVDIVGNTNDIDAVYGGVGVGWIGGDAIPYEIGSATTNAATLDFNAFVYLGDGTTDAGIRELDSLNPQLHLSAVPGGPFTLDGNIRRLAINTNQFIDGVQLTVGTLDLTKIGDGTVVLNGGNNDFQGTTMVEAGSLIVDTVINNDHTLTVAPGATIGGDGRVGSANATVIVQGNIDPGNRDDRDVSLIGTFNVRGVLDLSAATNLFFDLAAPGNGDRIDATTNVVLGGEMVIRNAGGLTDGTYNLIDSAGQSGVLPTVNTNLSVAGFAFVVTNPAPGNIDLVVTTTTPQDTDMDGMPDDYEDNNGLDKTVDDADLDLDKDGSSNIQEYVFGTDPQVDTEFFVLQQPAVAGGVDITYGPVKVGVTYNLQFAAELPNFSSVDTFTPGADAASNTVNDASGVRGYYRIEATR